jgi:pimeloyl-ACP methyl ester carboxylesterase
MHTIAAEHGVTISYDKHGSGPPLLLVHGSFSDHRSNWEFVLPYFAQTFTVYALARRGRGETEATKGHSLIDEAVDAAALIGTIDEPVFLLGHSYGAQVALRAAAMVPDKVRKLVLYEPAGPDLMTRALEHLMPLAAAGDWDAFSFSFFRDVLFVPADELDQLRASPLWKPILVDAPASLRDLLTLHAYQFEPDQFKRLNVPVLLQIGTESPHGLYVTDALAAALPNARIELLQGQAHEGMTTAPAAYADVVIAFLQPEKKMAHAAQP